jgi:hypothetical protein
MAPKKIKPTMLELVGQPQIEKPIKNYKTQLIS